MVDAPHKFVLNREFATAFASGWVATWNAHDLARFLAHYSDDFAMTSPLIPLVAGEPSGTLRGKAAVGAYWRAALQRTPNLHFELRGVGFGVNSLCVHYCNTVRNMLAIEGMRFGPDGKVVESAAHYSNELAPKL